MKYRIVKTTCGRYGVQVKKWWHFRWVFISLFGFEFENADDIRDFCLKSTLEEAQDVKNNVMGMPERQHYIIKINEIIKE